MAVAYLALLILTYVLDSNVNKKYRLKQKNRKLFLTFQMIFIVFLTLVLAFRDETVGADTRSYLSSFVNARYRTYDSIFNFDKDANSHEYLFYALTKFIASITENQIIFFGVYGLMFSVTYGYVVHRYSDNYMISYIVLLALYMSFIITGMRQVAAMSMLMISFVFVQKRKLIPFLICIAIAYYFHNTSIIFILSYPVAKLQFSRWHIIFLLFCTIMAYLLPNISTVILYDWLSWDKLENYETYEPQLSSSGFIIKLCILMFSLCYYKNTIKKNTNNIILYNMSVIGTGLQAFTVVMSQAFRMSMYFSIFDTILLSNVIQGLSADNKINQRNKIIIYVSVISVLLIYYFFVAGVIDYKLSIL